MYDLKLAAQHVSKIYTAATPVLKIHSIKAKRWLRDQSNDSDVGSHLQCQFDILNPAAWEASTPCLYLVAGSNRHIRYVGINLRHRLKDIWRSTRAIDVATMQRLPEAQIFHRQCSDHIDAEFVRNLSEYYEVRAITVHDLLLVLTGIGEPLSAFAGFRGFDETILVSMERWIRFHRSNNLAAWNEDLRRNLPPLPVARLFAADSNA